jgi:hypothetical protein
LAEGSSHDPKLIGLFKQGKAKLQALFALLRNGIIAPLTENNMRGFSVPFVYTIGAFTPAKTRRISILNCKNH